MFEKWRKDFHQSEYKKGQEAVSQEIDAERFEEQQDVTRRAMTVAGETIDLAEQLAADGDPHKQRLAALIKDSVVGAAQRVATGRHQVEGAREPLEADPFSSSSPPSTKSLPSSSMKALPHESPEPPKPKRGRPRKSPKS